MARIDKEDFRQGVYEAVKHIPRGRATSYGMIAKAIGYPNMSRLVGKVMGECPAGAGIPAHRVVNSMGQLSGREAFDNAGEMQRLLEAEGVKVVNNRICNWKSVLWDPAKELNDDRLL